MVETQTKAWTLGIGYDYRFGAIRVTPIDPDGNEVASFGISLAQLIRQAQVAPHELRAIAREAEREGPLAVGDIEPTRLKTLEMPNYFQKTVLDVGGYDGFAAKIAKDRGAARSICLDSHQYEHYGWEEKKAEGVEYITGDAFDWTEPVDIAICYNVLYHVKNPWKFLDHIRTITREEMLLCTLFRYHDGPWVYLYEPRECNPTDESVFWGPSITALERLLKFTGWRFEQTGLAMDRVCYRCWPDGDVQGRQSRW